MDGWRDDAKTISLRLRQRIKSFITSVPDHRFSAIVCYIPLHKFEKNEFENFSMLIFDALFITDLRIIPEG